MAILKVLYNNYKLVNNCDPRSKYLKYLKCNLIFLTFLTELFFAPKEYCVEDKCGLDIYFVKYIAQKLGMRAE